MTDEQWVDWGAAGDDETWATAVEKDFWNRCKTVFVGGTGNKVKISGFERWIFNEDGLVQESIGSFDSEEYKRQLNEGAE